MEAKPVTFTGKDNFFKRPYSLTSFFAIAILLFLLPFVEVKCGSTTLAENTGIGIAMGKDWNVNTAFLNDELGKRTGGGISYNKRGVNSGPNVFAIMALAAGFGGILFSLIKNPLRPLVAMCAGILGAAMMVALMIQLKAYMRANTNLEEKDMNYGLLITTEFTAWFYISLFGFIIAAIVGFRQNRDEHREIMKNTYDFDFEKREVK